MIDMKNKFDNTKVIHAGATTSTIVKFLCQVAIRREWSLEDVTRLLHEVWDDVEPNALLK